MEIKHNLRHSGAPEQDGGYNITRQNFNQVIYAGRLISLFIISIYNFYFIHCMTNFFIVVRLIFAFSAF